MTRDLKVISVCTGGEKPAPVYMHAQRWGGGFKANVLSDACLIDTCVFLYSPFLDRNAHSVGFSEIESRDISLEVLSGAGGTPGILSDSVC